MYDLHCHLLPDIDDGPKELSEAIKIAKTSFKNRITHAVVTPHITPGRYDNNLKTISLAYELYKLELDKRNVELKIGMAAEVRLGPELIYLFESDNLPFLGEYKNKKVLLLELPHDQIPPGSEKMIKWMFDNGITPMIAHPERNGAIIRKPEKLRSFIDEGCLLQLTASSLVGNFGPLPEKCAKKIIKKGWATILASDAHNLHKRLPELEPGRAVVEKMMGKEYADKMVIDIPKEIAATHFS